MKRIPPKKDYALQVRVQEMWERFEYPELPTRIPFELGEGAGGDPSILIAASDATPQSKAMAHLVATGINDDELINLALSIFLNDGPSQGGRLVLSEGNFFVRPDEVVVTDRMHLHGLGPYKTRLINVGAGTASSRLVEIQTDGEVSDLGAATGSSYAGHVFFNDFGRVRNISHIGPAATGVFINGAEQPMSDWVLNGSYTDAAAVVDFGTLTLTNVISTRADAAGGAFMRVTGGVARSTVLSNIAVFYQSGVGNGIELEDAGSLTLTGFSIRTPGNACITTNGNGSPTRINVSTGYLEGDYGVQVGADGYWYSRLSDLLIVPNLIGLDIDTSTHCQFSDILIYQPGEHGAVFGDALECDIENVHTYQPGRDTDNTFDGFVLNGDRNRLTNCRVTLPPFGNTVRYGINVTGGDCNVVVANMLGDPADYGTDALNNAGTNTQLFYPADATYGDNFTDCPTSP